MAPNWDDEFDFDEASVKQAAKKPKEAKKPKKEDNDFFDLDDVDPPKPSKLPIISQKPKQSVTNIPPIGKSNQPSKNSYDDYEEIQDDIQENKSDKKLTNQKSQPKANYYEEQIQEEKPQIVKKAENKPNPISLKKLEEEEEYYEELEEEKPLKKDPKKNQSAKSPASYQPQPEPEEYAEEEFDDYGEDFQEEVVETKPSKKQEPKKSQTTVNLKAKEKSVKQSEKLKTQQKKLVINNNRMFTNKQSKQKEVKNPPIVPKPPQKQNSNKPQQSKQNLYIKNEPKGLIKSSSRKSMQSNDSKKIISNSRVSVNKKTIDLPIHKHVQKVQRQFPESEQKISEYGNDKLNRLNEQVREMIRQFNEQLNELINKNMILLKEKPVQKKSNVQEKVRVLEQQLKSGTTALEVVQYQLQRLKGRQGELREQQYQLIMEKKIEDMKEVIKQTQKHITKLKFQVNNQGNKLSKHQVEKKIAQELHQIKIMLIQTKKEEQKNEFKLQKLQKMAEQLQSKNSDKDYELQTQVQTAKDKGIQINIKQPLKKKYDQLKIKAITLQNHKKVMDGLGKSKCEHLNHEIDQIRQIIKNTQSQLTNLNQSIEFSQEESKKLIKRAKENPKISQALAENLQKILKSIEDSQAINFYEIRTEGNNSQASQRPLKTSMYDNTNKQKPPMRNNSSKKQPSLSKQKHLQHSPATDEINLMRPNFMKKKDKNQSSPGTQQQHSKFSERIWKQQQQKKKKQEQQKQRRLVEQQKKRQQQQKRREAERTAEQDKKKPFNLKKNRMANFEPKDKPIQQTPQAQKFNDNSLKVSPQQEINQEEKPSLGPKFMRLSKKDKNSDGSKNDISINKPAEEIKKPLEEPPKIETKAVQQDQPSFVPKRFNLRNKIEKKDEGYTPTIEKIEKKQQPKQIKKQYTPNLNFKQQQLFKAPVLQTKKQQSETKLQIAEEKPRFNLRLKDRKKQNKQEEYIPSKLPQQIDSNPKSEVNSKGVYNPFNKDINSQKPKKEEQNPYQPSLKINHEKEAEKNIKIGGAIPNPIKESTSKQLNINVNNSANNPYAPKSPISNPYAQNQKDQNINNPYAQKQDLPKRQKQGPLRKNKLLNNKPKQKFNIYDQAQDLTQPQQHIPLIQPTPPPKQPAYNPAKTDELDLNAMLGIKKKQKNNDLDDLLGDIKIDRKKEKKKNNDFFNDLEL